MVSWISATARASLNPGSPCFRLATELRNSHRLDQLEIVVAHADGRPRVELHIGRDGRDYSESQVVPMALGGAVGQVELKLVHALEVPLQCPSGSVQLKGHFTARPLDYPAGFEGPLGSVAEFDQRTHVVFVGDRPLGVIGRAGGKVGAGSLGDQRAFGDEGVAGAGQAFHRSNHRVGHVGHVGR